MDQTAQRVLDESREFRRRLPELMKAPDASNPVSVVTVGFFSPAKQPP